MTFGTLLPRDSLLSGPEGVLSSAPGQVPISPMSYTARAAEVTEAHGVHLTQAWPTGTYKDRRTQAWPTRHAGTLSGPSRTFAV